MNFLRELKRRRVFKAALAYLVSSWLILQISSIIFPILQIEMAYQRWELIALAIGFPAWIIFAYIYEWTPEGYKQTLNIEEENEDLKSSDKVSTRYIIFGLSLAILLLITDKIFNLTSPSQDKIEFSTLAVLPFSHQSVKEDDEFFTSGVHEDLMTKLAGVKNFRIISKASVMKYKDFEGDLKKLGQKLNSDYILQGTVRRWEDQIRLTVQLVECKTNQAIWSNEYDGQMENVFDLQAEIATLITQKLTANLTKDEKKELEEAPTKDIAAYEDFLRARYILNKPRATYDDINIAITLLNNAVKIDDNFSKAWTLLVQAHSEIYSKLSKLEDQKLEMDNAKEKADFALRKAKALAPDNWEVLSEEGFYSMNILNDQISALNSFNSAIEQNPSDVNSMMKLGQLYVFMGDVRKAMNILERSFELTQTNGALVYFLTFVYEINGEYKKMVPFLERLYEIYPEDKHFLVEAKYYQFLNDGTLISYEEFKKSVEAGNSENPWDERAIKNMDMIVAMFNNEFETYHEDWKGKHENHIKGHNNWMCPLVTNDFINQARLLKEHKKEKEAASLIEQAKLVVLAPVNPNSVCVFNPEVYMPKLDYLSGNKALATEKIEELAIPIIQNKSFPTGAVERSVLLQAIDLISPEKVFYYYEQIAKNTISMTSFESICADPWTYPNLIKDPRFIAEVKTDGRFSKFLESYGFL